MLALVLGKLNGLRPTHLFLLWFLLAPFLVPVPGALEDSFKHYLDYFLSFSVLMLALAERMSRIDLSVRFNKYTVYFGTFFLYVLINAYATRNASFVNPGYGGSSLGRAIDAFRIFLTFFVCYQYFTPRDVWKLLYVYYYGFFLSLIGVLWNLVDPVFGVRIQGVYRLTSFFKDPNLYGLYLVPVQIIAILRWRHNAANRLDAIIVSAAFLAMLLTFSRSSILFLLVCVGIMLWIEKDREKKMKLWVVLLCAVALGSVLLTYRFLTEDMDKLNFSDFQRLALNLAAVNIGLEHFWSGVGFDNARYLIKSYQSSDYPIVINVSSIHNVYLRLFADLGILAAVSYTLALLSMLRLLFLRRSAGYVVEFGFFVILIYLMHGVLYHYYFQKHEFWFLFFLSLLALQLPTPKERKSLASE